MTNKPSFKDIAEALRADPEPFAVHVVGEKPTYRNSSQVRFYENQSLVVFTRGSQQGRYKSFLDESAKGDMVDLCKYVRGASPHEAIEFAKQFLGVNDKDVDLSKLSSGPSQEERRRQQEAEDAKRVRTARWIWRNSSPTDGREEGLAYLANRAITCPIDSETLRFRRLSPADLEKMGVAPAEIPQTPVTSLVFAARNAEGEIMAVQQILVTEGRKVRFDNPKRTNGLMDGAAVWLGNPQTSDTAILVEGPETGCSLHQATGLPTCIALGTSNFQKVALPRSIKTLITGADMEPSGVGLASALRTAQFWAHAGVERSGIALPRLNDGDFNDVHQHQGEENVRLSVETAFFPPHRERDGTVLCTADARTAFHAWVKTGIEVAPRVPGKNRDGKYAAIDLDNMVDEHHTRAIVIATPGIEIREEMIRKDRPELEIIHLSEDSRAFRALARTEGAMEKALAAIDIHEAAPVPEEGPVFFSLRRADAEALAQSGSGSIAIRSSAIERVDLTFMKGREAIVAPIGNGTEQDLKLTRRLVEVGAETTRLTWQIFRGDEATPRIIRREIPDGYGAADAAKDGWSGGALRDLIDISRANHRQTEIMETVRREPAPVVALTRKEAVER